MPEPAHHAPPTAGTKATIIITVVTAVVALAGVLVGIFLYGQTGFGLGLNARDVIRSEVAADVQQRPAPAPAAPATPAAPIK